MKAAPDKSARHRAITYALLVIGLGLAPLAGGYAPQEAAPAQDAAPVQDAAPSKTVWDGVYSEKQAHRGEAIYMDHCTMCHGDDLSGDTPYNPSPQLAGKAFLLRWDEKDLGSLFTLIRTQMPKDDPGTLNRQDYIDLVAFLLRSNKFPAGKEELTSDAKALKNVTILKDNPAAKKAIFRRQSAPIARRPWDSIL
jgi:cytochrome c